MRICRYDSQGIGAVVGNAVHDVSDLARQAGLKPAERATGDPLIAILSKLVPMLTQDALKAAGSVPLGSVALDTPVLLPSKIIGGGNNYSTHASEMGADPTASFGNVIAPLEEQGMFLKANSSLIGPSARIERRFPDRRTDHEIELVAVIGKTARRVDRSVALDHVAGYCLGLDLTLRGPEERSLRKSVDTYTVLGPWLVTSDELPDPSDVRLRLSVNGVVRQEASTVDMINDVTGYIAYASRFYDLLPGDLIYTGTPAGVGPVSPGDVIHAEADRIGAMTVKVEGFAGA